MTMAHHAVLLLFAVLLGSCAGSFLNVCVHRIPRGMSVLRPRSRCPGCGASIRARDNIPVLGWLLLGGRCRGCGGPIAIRYPAVELGIGLAFALPYLVIVAVVPGDPWERIGPTRLLPMLLASWTLGVVGAYSTLVACERRSLLNGRPAAGGCGDPASIALRAPADRG